MTPLKLGSVAMLALASAAVGTTSVMASPQPLKAGTVTICHFGGHKGDFVTANDGFLNFLCVTIYNGNTITIGIPACKNGHHADAVFSGNAHLYTCDGGDESDNPT